MVSKEWLAAVVLVLIVGSGAAAYLHFSGSAQAPPLGGSGGITSEWLESNIATWNKTAPSQIGFGMLGPEINYGAPGAASESVVGAAANFSAAAGLTGIRVDLGFEPWLKGNQTAIGEDTAYISTVRSSGEKLILADAASESYRGIGNCLPWVQFKQAWVQRVTTLAQLYHPDYYIVIKEPGWYVPMVCNAANDPGFTSPSDWVALAQQLAQAVKGVSPGTTVGVSIDAGGGLSKELPFYTSFVTGVYAIPSVGFVGYDIYTANAFNNTEDFLGANGSGGKQVWIAEAWSTTDGHTAADPSRSQLDVLWAQALFWFAEHVHASWIIPFFTANFVSYSIPTGTQALISAFASERTPVFYEYQALARTYGA